METGKTVMIGEVLATSEEMLPGPGTYDDGAHIRAARMGRFVVDTEQFAAVVDPATQTPVLLQPGDIIIGEVYTVQENLVGITASFRLGDERKNVSSDTNGTLHVSKVADRYIAVLDEVFKKGDIVRAKVLQGAPSLQLTTKGDEFGVIKSRCSRCRHVLERREDFLECGECQYREVRYIAGDYGMGELEPHPDNMYQDNMQRGDRLKQLDGTIGVMTRPPKRFGDGPGRGPPRGGGGGRGGPRGGGRGGDRGGRGGFGGGGRGRGPPRGGGGGRGGPRGGGRGGERGERGERGDREGRGGREERGGQGRGPPRGGAGGRGDRGERGERSFADRGGRGEGRRPEGPRGEPRGDQSPGEGRRRRRGTRGGRGRGRGDGGGGGGGQSGGGDY